MNGVLFFRIFYCFKMKFLSVFCMCFIGNESFDNVFNVEILEYNSNF